MTTLKPRTKREIARDYRAQGLTYKEIGDLMGCTQQWAYALCNDDVYERMSRRSTEWIRSGTCPQCGGPMTHPKFGEYARRKPTGMCRSCFVAKVKADRMAATVHGDTARCRLCKQFKPFADFPQGQLRKYLDGHTTRMCSCRACDTAARADYRRRHATPCTNCGNPRNGDEGGRGIDTGLCGPCYQQTRRKDEQ